MSPRSASGIGARYSSLWHKIEVSAESWVGSVGIHTKLQGKGEKRLPDRRT